MERAEFVTRVLAVFQDRPDGISWSVKDGQVMFQVVADYAFGDYWSDGYEDMTPERLPALERAYRELEPLKFGGYTRMLFIARMRGVRPRKGSFPFEAQHLLEGLADSNL